MIIRIRSSRWLARLAGAAMLSITALPAMQAQAAGNWPSEPIKLIVPSTPGQGTDLMARFVAERLGKALGQPMIVDNKPGASGTVGAALATKAKADGHTLLFTNASFTAMVQSLRPPTTYDLRKDLMPIVQIGAGGVGIAVPIESPIKRLAELVDHVRANPDKFNYGTWGTGSSAHLVMEYLNAKTGMVINHVPYKGTGQVHQDLMGGTLQVGWTDMTSALPLIKANRIRVLAVSGSRRFPASPEIPRLKDEGFDFDTDGWYGLFAPAGTPAAIVQRVNEEVNRIMLSADSEAQLLQLNLPGAPKNSPEEFAATLERDINTWTGIVQEHKIKVN